MHDNNQIIGRDELILVTAANGFIGSKVVKTLLESGFTNLRCFVRPSSNLSKLNTVLGNFSGPSVEIVKGNLLSKDDCQKAAKGARVILHLAAATSDKTFAGSFMNSVVTTRNLLDATVLYGTIKRFVNISSFAVYSNWNIRRRGPLDERCELETHCNERADPYGYAKLKQEQLVAEYAHRYGIPHVILRPGAVYGPGASHLNGRVGTGTFGIFLHLGGGNRIPFSYVDNCADAIVSAGLVPGVDGEVFNVVDDDLPTSRAFLKMYKKHTKPFRSIYIPYRIFYLLCWCWEKYSAWSQGQLPPVFNRRRCAAYWKGNTYSNQKLKDRLGWRPGVPVTEAMSRYFAYIREASHV